MRREMVSPHYCRDREAHFIRDDKRPKSRSAAGPSREPGLEQAELLAEGVSLCWLNSLIGTSRRTCKPADGVRDPLAHRAHESAGVPWSLEDSRAGPSRRTSDV